MASNDGIIWITYRGRKIPIKPGMKGKFDKKKLDDIKEKKSLGKRSNEDKIAEKEFEEASKVDDKLDRAILMQVADDVGKELDDDDIRFRAEHYVRNNYNGNATDEEIYEKLKKEYKNRGWYKENALGKQMKQADNTTEEYLGRLKKERQELLNTNPTSVEDGKRLQNEIKNLNYKINDIELKRTKEFNAEEYTKRSIESNKLTKSEINTQVEKSLDLADKVIADDEWNDVTTHRYGNGSATIESERTGKRVRIEPNETRESINNKLEYITSDNEYRSVNDELIEKNNKLHKELNEKGISYSDYEAGKMLEKKTNGRIKNWEDLDREVEKNKSIKEYAKKYGMSEEYVRNSINANKSDSQKLLDTVEKNRAGKEYRDKLNKISDKSIPDGTYDVDTGKAVDFKGEGYNVSFEQSGVKLTNDEYYDRIEECRNKCDGKVYAGKFGGDPEISFYTKDKKVALELMEKYNQHSIWDNSIGDIIENPNYDESKNKVNYKKDIVDIPGFKDYEYNKKTDTVSIKKSKLRTLSDIEQYYINMGYSKATALKYAKQEIAERKKR